MLKTQKTDQRIHAGEFLVGQPIESSFKDKNVWVPTRDLGIDLLVTNSVNTSYSGRYASAVSLQASLHASQAYHPHRF
jgi:hypothetical protein